MSLDVAEVGASRVAEEREQSKSELEEDVLQERTYERTLLLKLVVQSQCRYE